MNLNTRAAIFVLAFGMGCDTKQQNDTASDAEVLSDFTPTLPNGGCGLESYEWLPTGDMGEILDWEWIPDLSMSPASAAAARVAVGLEGFDNLTYGTRVYRVRYRTQDRGQAVEATAFLAFPTDDSGAVAEAPTGLWVHPTMGVIDACGPTGLGLVGAAYPMLMASAGFAVAAPDYLGMNGWGDASDQIHPYIIPEPTAVASLDAVRALWRFADESIDPAAKMPLQRGVIWGASEGGFAALWADRYAPGYLPEFKPDGVSAAAAPIDLESMLQSATTDFSETTGGLAVALYTMYDWFGQNGDLNDVFVNDGDVAFLDALQEMLSTSCEPTDLFDEIDSVDDVFQTPFIDAASVYDSAAFDPWSCYTSQSTLTKTEIPLASDSPILMIQGEDDGLIQPRLHEDDVLTLCDDGYRIEYLECAGAGHVDGILDSLEQQIAWIQARAAQAPWEPATLCEITAPIACEE